LLADFVAKVGSLTDGERTYLTDFGLVLDKSFTLTDDEMAFFQANTHYDYREVLSYLGTVAHQAYAALSENDKRQLGTSWVEEICKPLEVKRGAAGKCAALRAPST